MGATYKLILEESDAGLPLARRVDNIRKLSNSFGHLLAEHETKSAGNDQYRANGGITLADLRHMKSTMDAVLDASEDGREQAFEAMQATFSATAIPRAVKTEYWQAAEALRKAEKSAERWLALETVQAFNELSHTYELVAPADGARDGASTWNNTHLVSAKTGGAPDVGHALLGRKTTLEIGGEAGYTSKVPAGDGNGALDVGTIRAGQHADHDIALADGALTVHRGIEGTGKLTIHVGTAGVLHFNAGGVGVADEFKTLRLRAGVSETDNEPPGEDDGLHLPGPDNPLVGGRIVFDEGTSAARANLSAAHDGQLRFHAGANAGDSLIDVHSRGEAHFSGADLARAKIDVFENGAVQASAGARMGQSRLVNRGQVVIRDSFADGADIENLTQGALMISKTRLDNMDLTNVGAASISASRGGNARVDNVRDARLVIGDSELERLRLRNAGTASMTGTTTAHDASIELAGGSLDISGIAPATQAGGHTGAALGIGTLTGEGDIVTGETVLMLGALGRDDAFGGRIMARQDGPAGDETARLSMPGGIAPETGTHTLPITPPGAHVVKVGAGNLTLSGDQRGIANLRVDDGRVTAAHAQALGTGNVSVGPHATLALAQDVAGVRHIDNAGKIDLSAHRLSVERYASRGDKAQITAKAVRDGEHIARGTIHVEKDGDFRNTTISLIPDAGVALKDLVDQKLQVVTHDDGATVEMGEVVYGSIRTDVDEETPADPEMDDDNPGEPNPGDNRLGNDKPYGPAEGGGTVTITQDSKVGFLARDAAYGSNERAVLTSIDGISVGDIASRRIGGAVLDNVATLIAGSAEQRQAARMLSGESLVNNAYAAQGAATRFQRNLQARTLAGGTMLDDKATGGAASGDHGIAGWASFDGGKSTQRDEAVSFDVQGVNGAIGVDKRLGDDTRLGAAFGLGNQTSSAGRTSGESKIDSVSVGLYGSHLNDANLFVNGGVSYTHHSVATDRTVAAGEASARLSGKTRGNTFGAFGEVGQRFDVAGFHVDPSVGVRIASSRLAAFDETNRDGGAGHDGLKVGAQSQTSARGVLGVRFSRDVFHFDGGKATPSLRLAYEHEFGNTQSQLANTIYGAPRAFNVMGPKLGRDVFTADLGVDLRIRTRLDVHVGANVGVRKGENALAGSIAAKYRF
ncbi:autotransporter family protein [Pandoraea anhela]|uniref:autotransporter family protein n=1 Tax=Pandoraea anhela TaxID=2508295 RepID=UPI001584053D|nr:autotransporter outer membrane beta-barrel domain-containing protein [Pandoraea anhela]